MRAIPAVLVVAVAVLGGAASGCTTEDPYPVRPGGGGTGGGGQPDAGPPGDAPPAGELTGEVCVVLRYDAPGACPTVALRGDVLVEEVLGDAATRSDADGGFTIAADGEALLRIGAEPGDGLVATFRRFAVTAAPVAAPVIDETLWLETLDALLELDTIGALVVYVVDTAGAPVGGAIVGFGGVPPAGARLYYDDGGGGWILDDGLGTGPDGIALILDAGPATVAASVGARAASAELFTAPGSIGIGRLVLPD